MLVRSCVFVRFSKGVLVIGTFVPLARSLYLSVSLFSPTPTGIHPYPNTKPHSSPAPHPNPDPPVPP